jgi:CHASE2 domain-containing sensor protein
VFATLRKPAWLGLGLGLIGALLSWLLVQAPLLRDLEDWLFDSSFISRGPRPTEMDSYFVSRGPRPSQTRVVLIGIDDASLDKLGKLSGNLSPELAEVVRYAHDQHAAAIGIDLFIPESKSTLPDIETRGGPGDARPLGAAILDAGNVVLPQWRLEDRWERPLLQWRLKEWLKPELTDLGFINLTEDNDQFVRRQQLVIRDGNAMVPHFALALWARARGAAITWDDEHSTLQVGGEPVPLDDEQELRINYVGPPGTFPPVPFHKILTAARKGQSWPEMNGAIVLIGITARSQQDYHSTPYGLMSGTEVHAHILATLNDRAYLSDQAFVRTPPEWATLLVLLVYGALLGGVLMQLRPLWSGLLAVALSFAWVGLGVAAFTYGYWRIELVALVLLGVLTCALTAAVRYWLLKRPTSQALTLAPTAGGLTASYSPTGTSPQSAAAEEDLDRWHPSVIAGYQVVEILGRGGMGVVYKAWQVGLKRTVALKMILAGSHASRSELTRFRIEAEAVARMQHPNIVQVYEIGEHEGRPFFSLEFVDGGSLARKLKGEPLSVRQAVDLIVTLGRAVQHAHERGVIHRDLKPANVLLTAAGVPKIADFGLAKKLDEASGLSHSGAVIGTPSYMAPEQAEGRVREIGPATDVYALGAILYELLTGRPPFQGDTFVGTLDKVRFQAPVPPIELEPTVPPVLETICLKCLEKEPARRYPTAEALVQVLLEACPR